MPSIRTTCPSPDLQLPPRSSPQAHLPFNKGKVLRKHTIIDNVNGVLKVGGTGLLMRRCAATGSDESCWCAAKRVAGDCCPAHRLSASGFQAAYLSNAWLAAPSHLPLLQPGRITLLLGTPGSGRSVLMKALSGRLRNEKALKVHSGHAAHGLACLRVQGPAHADWLTLSPLTQHDVILGASPANSHPSHGLSPPQVTYDELSYNSLCIDSGNFVPERSAAYIEQL